MRTLIFLSGCLAAAIPAIAQKPPDILAKARAAFESNRGKEQHWNWTTVEKHVITDPSGQELQRLPDVTIESVIRQDGRRCNAVAEWGDGLLPYKLDADAEVRCANRDPLDVPLQIEYILAHAKVTLRKSVLVIKHDKSKVSDLDQHIRCIASIEGEIHLDPETFFPVRIEGKIVDNGCERGVEEELRYGNPGVRTRTQVALHKGTEFRLEYALQPDKYGHPENSYWINTAQHWSRPIARASSVVYCSRRVVLEPMVKSGLWLQDFQTTAKEFGADSVTRFDTLPK